MAYASPLLVAVEESDSTLHLRLSGDFDRAGVRPVEHALDRLRQTPAPRRVVFDLRGLAFLGLARLLTIFKTDAEGRTAEVEVLVVRPPGTANRVFTLTRAGERLNIIDEPDAA